VDLTVNLGASASGNTCTSTTSSAATTANKAWLQGDWGSGSYSDNTRGRATFGIYKNADQFLYLREVY
jgi:MSHA biogenesis protein MshQ